MKRLFLSIAFVWHNYLLTNAIKMLNFKNEGRVEFYLDELGGKPAATVEVTDRDMIKVVPVLYEVRGKHDIYLLFREGTRNFSMLTGGNSVLRGQEAGHPDTEKSATLTYYGICVGN